MELSEQDLARIIRQAIKSATEASISKERTSQVYSGTVEQIDAEDLDVAFIRMDNEVIGADPTQSMNYEMPGVIPATRLGQTFDGEQVRVTFDGSSGADAMQTSAEKRIVLPYGVESGQRLLLDGTTGFIEIYNSSDALVGQLRPSGGGGFIAAISPDGARAALISQSAGAFVELTPENWPTHTRDPALISADISETQQVGRLILQSPAVDSQQRLRVFMTSEKIDGATKPSVSIDGETEPADLLLNSRTLPRGRLLSGFARSTGNGAAAAPGAATDMTVTVSLIGGRTYSVRHESQYTVSAAAQVYACVLDYDGTIIGRLGRWSAAETPAGSQTIFANGEVVFTASADDTTAVFTVYNDAGSGGNITPQAGVTFPRTLIVEDLGAP